MARLSKAENKLHQEAVELLRLDRLDDDQREFVLINWQESANHVNSAAGAFFTPTGLARDLGCFAQYNNGDMSVIDLCAGIGGLGLWTWWISGRKARVTCIEANPDYVAIGRKMFPEATWICASVENAVTLGRFDVAISNPPFGKTTKIKGPRFSGEDDLAVVDIASDLAEFGVFILPQMSCPFQYSGRRFYEVRPSAKHDRFKSATDIELNCESIDASIYADDWKGVSPSVEVASADFSQVQASRAAQHAPDLFGLAA